MNGQLSGVGIDILELARVRSIRHLSRVAELVFSTNEQRELREHGDPIQYFASRFSAKEAVIKAYPGALQFRDFEITKSGQKPVVHFLSARTSRCDIQVSISHSDEYAAGFAVALAHDAP